jgi:hypothetical protein
LWNGRNSPRATDSDSANEYLPMFSCPKGERRATCSGFVSTS